MGRTRKNRPYTVEVRTMSYTSVDVVVSAGSVKDALMVAARGYSGDNIKLVIKDAPKNRKKGDPKPEKIAKVPGKRGPKTKPRLAEPGSIAAAIAEVAALVPSATVEATIPATEAEVTTSEATVPAVA